MKIENVTQTEIIFDNGNIISFNHEQSCHERNWADFSELTKNTPNIDHDFDPDLEFEFISAIGFKFGDKDVKLFVPCYSDQSGYYYDTADIEILYNGVPVLTGICKELFKC